MSNAHRCPPGDFKLFVNQKYFSSHFCSKLSFKFCSKEFSFFHLKLKFFASGWDSLSSTCSRCLFSSPNISKKFYKKAFSLPTTTSPSKNVLEKRQSAQIPAKAFLYKFSSFRGSQNFFLGKFINSHNSIFLSSEFKFSQFLSEISSKKKFISINI